MMDGDDDDDYDDDDYDEDDDNDGFLAPALSKCKVQSPANSTFSVQLVALNLCVEVVRSTCQR